MRSTGLVLGTPRRRESSVHLLGNVACFCWGQLKFLSRWMQESDIVARGYRQRVRRATPPGARKQRDATLVSKNIRMSEFTEPQTTNP